MNTYDVIVIGAGPVGENAADRAVQGGLSAVIVEAELVGGECSYWACMPTKALLRPGHALAAARAVPGAREVTAERIDAAASLAYRDSFASHWKDDGQVSWLSGAGIDLVRGRGRLAGERTVEVVRDGEDPLVLTARHAVVLATGSRPTIPPVPGLAEASPWTNREAISAESVPERVLIIGGGVVGSEFATAFTDLGSRVTMLVRGERLLERNEPFAGEAVAASLREMGADVRLGTSAERVERGQDGVVRATLGSGEVIEADEVVVATGRRPAPPEGAPERVQVDEAMRVLDDDGAPLGWLWAVGDVNGRALLTHQGKYQARAAGDAIAAIASGRALDDAPWGAHVATADHDAVPQVTFTRPEVASVGLSAAQATERFGEQRVKAVDYNLGWVAGAAVFAQGYTGQARLVVDTERSVVLGATFVGADVGELVQAATMAVVGEIPVHRLWHAVPAYPTISEIWLRLLEELGRDSALTR
ncbi:dihydrolipoyl dehydrogenase family protein [Serinibacter salmoneus]|uniref:Dihydrolipoamide dehydrogenase n=1 Tax=Serinibacter salmoneus TaxID=556530 RepID=A0A2A9CZ38_9MICO|nr:NAD(P)/FAD-dependent oxidoreductase [Serinibacter salmoneus]PFG19708.1 dihydrolipoamide dehydrogenase [Serinibacter salmoneus]